MMTCNGLKNHVFEKAFMYVMFSGQRDLNALDHAMASNDCLGRLLSAICHQIYGSSRIRH
eukprot:3268152-Amphidinium_carterae.1